MPIPRNGSLRGRELQGTKSVQNTGPAAPDDEMPPVQTVPPALHLRLLLAFCLRALPGLLFLLP